MSENAAGFFWKKTADLCAAASAAAATGMHRNVFFGCVDVFLGF